MARNLGQGSDVLDGQPHISFIELPTLQQGKASMSRATEEQRRLRSETFFDKIHARSRLGQGMHDRGEAYMWGAHPIDTRDHQGQDRHLPLCVKVISILNKVVPAGEVWDVSVRATAWNRDIMEDVYCVLNLGTLVLEPGASVAVRGNIFTMVCQRLIKIGFGPNKPSAGSDHGDIGILPTPYPMGNRQAPFHGRNGANGADGASGTDGLRPTTVASLLGQMMTPRRDGKKTDGLPGTDGLAGERGENGMCGGACKLAEINLRQIQSDGGPVVVFSQAGRGGNGGHGGNGGNGGDGGKGIEGIDAINGLVPSGRGGNGGNGGTAGDGGNGGNGGISSNVYVVVSPPQKDLVQCISRPSEPGMPGKRGAKGLAGIGGTGGGSTARQSAAESGTDGLTGAPGSNGGIGRARPGASMFLNERPIWCRG